VEDRAVVFCWASPAQSFVVSDFFGTPEDIFVLFNAIYILSNGAASSTKEGPDY
jgi:hypothetical protein